MQKLIIPCHVMQYDNYSHLIGELWGNKQREEQQENKTESHNSVNHTINIAIIHKQAEAQVNKQHMEQYVSYTKSS